MSQLRPKLSAADFVGRVEVQQREGYRLAFLVGAICAAAAGLIGGAFMRTRTTAVGAEQAMAPH